MLDLMRAANHKSDMKHREKATLYRELAKLIEAALHLDRSLELLLSQSAGGERRKFLEGLKRGLESGMSLAESVKAYNSDFVTGLELALIEAGERSGKLGVSFNHLARYFAAMETAERQAGRAMIYPLILAHLAILLPELPALIVEKEGDHPLQRMLLGLGVLWAVLIGLRFIWDRLAAMATTSPSIDGLLNRVPFIGKARRHWAMARFCQVSHACLLAALNMSETVRLAGRASQSGRLSRGAEAAAEYIEAGHQLGESLAESGVFELGFVHGIATAEEVGKIDEEMARWSTAETLEAHQAIESAAQWLPKMGYAVVVVFVVYRIVTMMQGIYAPILQMVE